MCVEKGKDRETKAGGERDLLWRLKSPMTGHLQPGDPGKLEVSFSLSSKPQNQGSPWYISQPEVRRR